MIVTKVVIRLPVSQCYLMSAIIISLRKVVFASYHLNTFVILENILVTD